MVAVRAQELTPTSFCLHLFARYKINDSIENVFSGDGGNDVSMIQAADCGIGIEGKVKGCEYIFQKQQCYFLKIAQQ